VLGEGGTAAEDHALALFEDGEAVEARAGGGDFRFLLVPGRPLGEPVAGYGPIVMKAREEAGTAFEDRRQGAFIR
jgi:hypothetical protein